MNNQVWVYDIETLAGCFTYTAINISTQEIVKFVIHKDKNEFYPLITHLYECKGQIGFNNLNFDYPVIHYMINLYERIKNKSSIYYSSEEIITLIYKEAQRIIDVQNDISRGFKSVAIKKQDVKIPQLDLFRIWHFNNLARSTNLKSLQISMNYPNVLEMPISHDTKNIPLEKVQEILDYNLNDVLSTYEFYKKSLDKIQLRKDIKKQYNLDCINFPDVKIGEQLLLKLYSELSDQDEYDVRSKRTYRDKILLSECIFDYIQFDSVAFNNLLNEFKSIQVVNTKNGFSKSLIYKGFKYDYGLGGIHGCIKSGVYTSDNEYCIYDLDVNL